MHTQDYLFIFENIFLFDVNAIRSAIGYAASFALVPFNSIWLFEPLRRDFMVNYVECRQYKENQ